jgi:hypothetical protein
MSSVWARVEPLLARVHKPARYIGCEDGAIPPRHEAFGPAGPMAWSLAFPDTYETGSPNQGLQILYEIFNERDEAVVNASVCLGATSLRHQLVDPLDMNKIRTHPWTNDDGHRREVLSLPADVNAPDLRVGA